MICDRLLSENITFFKFEPFDVLDAFSFGDDPVRRLLRSLDPMVSAWSSVEESIFEFEGSTDKHVELSMALDAPDD